MNISIIDEVVGQLKVMPQHLQWQVLQFVRTLIKLEVRGVPGQQLLQFAGSIPSDDLQVMREAIEQDRGSLAFSGALKQLGLYGQMKVLLDS
jgi:hypothetical protein